MTAHSAKGLEFPYVFVSGMEENLFPSGGWMLTEPELEEERRLFYVALTRAKTAVALTFAQTRMRNGKHESNAPSRFLREIAPQYLQNPLRKEDFQVDRSMDDDDHPGFRFGRFGGGREISPRASLGRNDRGGVAARNDRGPMAARNDRGPAYGHNDRMDTRGTNSPVGTPRPTTREALLNRPLPPKVPDSEFTPDPMSSFQVGDRIEHNRFGVGKVLKITGEVPDIKAIIAFEKFGEKILLLKYAKIRHI